MGELAEMVGSIATNLVLPDGLLKNYMQPLGCGPVEEVSTVLVTRYWVAEPGIEVDWDLRAWLFSDWCLPSVVGQTRPPQAWLILVSDWAYDRLGLRVHRAVQELPYAHLVVVPTGRSHSQVTREWMVENPQIRRPWTAAFRFDSDDAIARDFLDAAAKWIVRAKPKTPCTLVFPHGLQHDLRDHSTRLDIHGTNHFSGVLTARSQPFLGAFGPNHTEIYSVKDPSLKHGVRQLNTRWPMWTEILHRANAANHHRTGPPMSPDREFWFDRFNVSVLQGSSTPGAR